MYLNFKKAFEIGILAVITIIAFTTFASAETLYSGHSTVCSSDIDWSIDSNGELRLIGTGDAGCGDGHSFLPWSQYDDIITSIYVGEGITLSGGESFCGMENVTYAELPNSATELGDECFYNCKSLSSIKISDSLTEIEDSAFAGCQSLQSITIPESTTYIDSSSFDSAFNITVRVYDDSYAMKWCKRNGVDYEVIHEHTIVDDPYIAPTRFSIGKTAGSHCSTCGYIVTAQESIPMLKDDGKIVAIPDSVITIADEAFENTGAECVIIPSTCETIGSKAFADSDSLELIIIPSSVTGIAADAFENSDNIVIKTTANSYAMNFAVDNHIVCVLENK